jgi:hypothetical protein
MNFPAVKPVAPSTHPALELIALAQLSPENARQRLRALLLANPKYFGNVPPASFNAVLKIQEDTTYECISSVAYDAQFEQLRASIDIRQAVGYSGAAQLNSSEEFVRFYLSHDGGATWADQGMRSVKVFDSSVPRLPALHAILQILSADLRKSSNPKPRVRAILSWNSPPPAGAPNWTPVWGNVAESELLNENARETFSLGLKAAPSTCKLPESTLQATEREELCRRNQKPVGEPLLPSSKTDPQHQFLNDLFVRAARRSFAQIPNPASLKRVDSPGHAVSRLPFPVPNAATTRFGAAL